MSTATSTAMETKPEVTIAKVGKPAPDFNLPSTKNMETLAENISLADYKGKWLILLFYPLDFTFVCPTELTAFSDRLDEINGIGAEVLGASTDSVHSHRAWIKTPRDQNGIEGLAYPLISDVGGKLVDMEIELPPEILNFAAEFSRFQPESLELTLRGLCPDCNK